MSPLPSHPSLCLLSFPRLSPFLFFFFFNDTATTEIYTLSLHDALPIFDIAGIDFICPDITEPVRDTGGAICERSEGTRLNSSHMSISYAVFCLKKKKKKKKQNKIKINTNKNIK